MAAWVSERHQGGQRTSSGSRAGAHPRVKPGAMQLLVRQRLRRLPLEALAQSCCGTLSAMLIQIPLMLATPSANIFSGIAR